MNAAPPLLVTGSRGLLGATVAFAAAAQYKVFAAHRSRGLSHPQIESVFLDLTDPGGICAALDRVRPAVIVHCAAATNVDWCEDHQLEAERVNVTATTELVQWAANAGARFVHVSTDAVFNGTTGNYREADAPSPLNHYAATKLRAEESVRAVYPGALIVRASMYGWNGQPKFSLAEWALDSLRAGRVTPGFIDVTFTPLLTNTLASLMLDLVDAGATGIFHVASHDAMSKYGFLVTLADVFGLDAGLVRPAKVAESRLKAPRPMNTSLVSDKMREFLRCRPPAIREDLDNFRRLADAGFVRFLKQCFQ